MTGGRGQSACSISGALGIVLAIAISLATNSAIGDPSDADEKVALDADYVAGKQAIEASNWTDAVQRMQRAEVRFPDNADLQNYLGYAHRKLGQFDLAFKHYKQALALDPRHRGAHEYIGETYLMVGDLAGAERHLAALRDICLLPCEEFDDLQKAIAAYQLKGRPR